MKGSLLPADSFLSCPGQNRNDNESDDGNDNENDDGNDNENDDD